jgi:ferric-dicitrate binding protein FerR (iron transport regulator)
MTAAQPPIDQDVLVGLRQGDDRSLEQLFRDRYPGLLQEAAKELDNPAAAPRVVERAFLRVWDEREKFETREALDSFLRTAVHDSATRERKRLATLHRFEAGAHVNVAHHTTAPPPTADEAWAHLKSALHTEPADVHAAARAQATHLQRHDAAEHVASIGKRKIPWGMLAVGAAVAALVAAPLYWAEQSGTDAAANRALASTDARAVSTVTGQQAAVTLLDGSQAKLGADTKLVIAPDFGTTVRAIKVDGAALFTVAPGQKHPFYVRAGNATVTATGTTFGVHAFLGDETVVVAAREGSVHVKAGDAERDVTAPNGVVVTTDGEIRDATAPEIEEGLSWTQDQFTVANRPLREALRRINRWYAIDLVVRDSALLTRPVSVKAGLQASGDAIKELEKTGRLKFGYDDKTMVLTDAGAGS